jgi:hypothetical protein
MIPILFRYFMAASLMHQEFDRHLRDPKDMELLGDDPMSFLVSKAGLKMCLWYGMPYVVIEGWREATLSDRSGRLGSSRTVAEHRHFKTSQKTFQT